MGSLREKTPKDVADWIDAQARELIARKRALVEAYSPSLSDIHKQSLLEKLQCVREKLNILAQVKKLVLEIDAI